MNKDLFCPNDCKELIEHIKIETTFSCNKYNVKLQSNGNVNIERCFMCRNKGDKNEKRSASPDENS